MKALTVCRGRPAACPVLLTLLVFGVPCLQAQPGLVTREEALASAYPGAAIVPERVFLTQAQVDEINTLSGEELGSKLQARYMATRNDRVVGRAYVQTHIVRTKRQSLLIALEPDGRVRRIDVTAFLEPRKYMASEAWRGQYGGRLFGEALSLRRDIRPIAGATLTARAINAAVRRVLVMDAVLEGRPLPP